MKRTRPTVDSPLPADVSKRRASKQRRKSKPSPESNSSAASVDEALTQSRAAVAALKAAAGQAPARYDVALRYRLDALAHHLQQVTEFVESARRS